MNEYPDYLTLPASALAAVSKVQLEVVADRETLHEHFARTIADEIKAHNAAGAPTRLILPVGPTEHYPLLARLCNEERISWRDVFTFNMDEYCDWQGRAVPVEHPSSFEGFMRRNLFDLLDADLRIPDDHVHFPDPLNLDRISERIREVGGVDSCYGGIGYHGHVAFNEAVITRWYRISVEEYRNSLTRLVHLAPETIVINSSGAAGGHPDALPPMAVTLGMRDIIASRRIRLYCTEGPWQRAVVRIAMMGEQTVNYPVTLLQGHPDYQIIADENTAQPPLPTGRVQRI